MIKGIILLLVCAGCSTSKLNHSESSRIHKISVISLVGNRAYITEKQTSMLSLEAPETPSMDVSDWKIDDTLESYFSELLGQQGKQVIRIPSKARSTLNSRREHSKSFWHALSPTFLPELRDPLVKMAIKKGIDHILVIQGEAFKGPKELVGPYGVVCRTSSFSKNSTETYLMFNVYLWDVKNEEIVFKYVYPEYLHSVEKGSECSEFGTKDRNKLEKYQKTLLDLAKKGFEIVKVEMGLDADF